MPITPKELEKRFTYHAPLPGQPALYEQIRYTAKEMATTICALSPESREQSLAITALEESVMWANAAIARHPMTEDMAYEAVMASNPMSSEQASSRYHFILKPAKEEK